MRCSKTIPCTACFDRGEADSCRRRPIYQDVSLPVNSSLREAQSPHINNGSSVSGGPFISAEAQALTFRSDTYNNIPEIHVPSRSHMAAQPSPNRLGPDDSRPIYHIAVDTPVTLEFFTLNRRRVSRLTHVDHHVSGSTEGLSQPTADPIMTVEQLFFLLDYHETNLTWTHNIVHLPTFRTQCVEFLTSGRVADTGWLALYYALLSVCNLCLL